MRLLGTPSQAALSRAYFELSRLGARAEGRRSPWKYGRPTAEELLVLASQMARYDARLLWVLVELLAERYDSFNPLALRRALALSRWPATLAVALEFARRARPSQELDDYAGFVTRRVRPAAGERFFILGLGGERLRRDAEESLGEYKRWGYLSREEPLAKELGAVGRGTLGLAERLNVLRRVLDQRVTITLADYVEALGGRASYRQASRDLARAPFLVREGHTRGARYSLQEPTRAVLRLKMARGRPKGRWARDESYDDDAR